MIQTSAFIILYAYCGNNPVMRIDENGNEWWHWLVGGALILGSIILTVVTGGAAAGTIAAAVHSVATGAMIGGAISATLGAVAGGLTYENGTVNWSWNGAAEGFMWGAIMGTASGAIGSALSGVGKGLSTFSKMGKLGYTSIQGLINSGVAATLTAAQGVMTKSFSLESVGLSAISGFFGGAVILTKYGKGKNNVFFNIVRIFVESLIGESKEWYKNA